MMVGVLPRRVSIFQSFQISKFESNHSVMRIERVLVHGVIVE